MCGGALSWIRSRVFRFRTAQSLIKGFRRIRRLRIRRLLKKYIGSPKAPHYPLSRSVLVSIALSAPLLSCGDGGTGPSELVDDTDFTIELVFVSQGTPSQNAAFIAAADRWMSIVQGELSDIDFSSNPVSDKTCGQGVQHPEVSDTVDDHRIFIDIRPIDGVLGTLGQAGFCQIRSDSRLPVLGYMSFDSEDLGPLEQAGDLAALTLHEMGHVLGVGTLWADSDTLLVNPSLPSNSGADTHFAGAAAIAAFDAAGGTAYTGGAKVPVENVSSAGSSDTHWRESVLGAELMTPSLQGGVANPLSAITTESLADLGYSVDSAGADSFTVTISAPAPLIATGTVSAPARLTAAGTSSTPAPLTAPGGRVLNLENDTPRGPVQVVDHSGYVTRTILRR